MNPEPAPAAAENARLREAVWRMVADAEHRWTPLQVAREVSRRLGVGGAVVRGEIASLVQEGRLTYSLRQGTAFLEPSLGVPVRVSERIWICPPRCASPADLSAGQVLIRMHPGAAFGIGDHPTTRLALRGLAFACPNAPSPALDIGTGTGVLAIAAALFGAIPVLALDVDPCARTEAAANVAENGLSDRIQVADCPFDRIQGRYSLVLANLRPPTLSQLAERAHPFSGIGTKAVLSGFRPEEWPPLEETYRAAGWRTRWVEIEKGWMAVVCRKER